MSISSNVTVSGRNKTHFPPRDALFRPSHNEVFSVSIHLGASTPVLDPEVLSSLKRDTVFEGTNDFQLVSKYAFSFFIIYYFGLQD